MQAMFEQKTLEPVRRWVLANTPNFLPDGLAHRYAPLHLFFDIPQEVWVIKDAVVEEFDLRYTSQEPVYRDFCSVITTGGGVQRHRDPNQGRLIHTRFNVMVSRPWGGGEPIIGNEILDVPEGGVYCVEAGLKMHGCRMVGGAKPRIILSFGFLCHTA